MRNANVAGLVLLSCLALSCTVLSDTEQKQCTKAADCGVSNGQPVYACENNFCRFVSCSADSECVTRGAFVCEAEQCVPALCTDNEGCGEGGDVCMGGRCVDPVFYCFDDQPELSSSEPAVLSVTVVNYGDGTPIKDLTVTVCAIADTPCNSPLAVTRTYSPEGKLEIRGLTNGKRYSVRLDGKDSGGNDLLETEYYMQRPVIGFTQEADIFELVTEGLISLLAISNELEYDPTKGLVIAEIFGCDDKPLAGVSVTNSRMGTLFYLTGAPNPQATETDGLGQAGLLNMEVAGNGSPLSHKLTFSYGAQNLYSFTVTPRPRVLTFLNLYMPDYRSTTDRVDDVMP